MILSSVCKKIKDSQHFLMFDASSHHLKRRIFQNRHINNAKFFRFAIEDLLCLHYVASRNIIKRIANQ